LRGNKEPFGAIRLVLFCDFLQLPPVKSDIFCFDAICWRRLDLEIYHLDQIVRQKDEEFQHILNKIRIGFVDEMVEGKFKSFKHEHYFIDGNGFVMMIDKIQYQTPYGIFGKLFDVLILKKHLTNFISERNKVLKELAENH
jgi:hypothetical protein